MRCEGCAGKHQTMAQSSVNVRGRTLSGGPGPLPSSSRPVRNERYRELKQQEQEARKSSKEITNLEAEIRDLSATIEQLKQQDVERVQRLGELARLLSTEKSSSADIGDILGENGWARVDTSDAEQTSGDLHEELVRLNQEHEASQSCMLSAQATCEQKRAELEMLSGEYKALSDQIAKDATELHTADADDSLQQNVAVQHGIRSLSEDIGRLGRIMEGLTSADQLTQNLRRPQKPRVMHSVTSSRNRNLARNFQNGGASDLGRVTEASSGRIKEPTRAKEPTQLEEKETRSGGGGNRKRQKSGSFELEREPLHDQRVRLEMVAKEKQTPVDSVADLPSRTTESEPVKRASYHGRSASVPILSPSSVFESFEESPSLGPVRTGSSSSTCLSSEVSSEFSVDKVDKALLISAAKRLDFESPKEPSATFEAGVLPEDTVGSCTTEETWKEAISKHKETIWGTPENSDEVLIEEVVTEVSFSSQVEEVLAVENETEEIQRPAQDADSFEDVQADTLEHVQADRLDHVQADRLDHVQADRLEQEETPDVTEEEAVMLDGTESIVKDLLFTEIVTEEIERPGDEFQRSEQGETSGAAEDESLMTGKGRDEPGRASEDSESYSQGEVAEEAAEEDIEEVEKPLENFKWSSVAVEAKEVETRTRSNRVDEIDIPWEEVEGFGDADVVAEDTMESQILTAECETEELERPTERTELFGDGEIVEKAIEAEPQSVAHAYRLPQIYQNCLNPAESGLTEIRGPPDPEQLSPDMIRTRVKLNMNEPWNMRLEAENQMTQLSSQLSFLCKQVEEEVQLHEKTKNDVQLEHSADTEQLSRQVAFFADEVTGLRHNIDEIQRNLYKEGEDRSVVEQWAKNLHSKCADQSAQLEHLGKQVGLLDKELKYHLNLRVNIEGKLEKEEQERLKVEAQLTDLSKALALTVSTIAKEEEAVGELVEQQKHLLVDQLKEAEKLRKIAEVRVETLNKQIEHLELVCDVAQNIQIVSKYQDKVLKYGLQALVQLFMLVIGVITLYSRVAEPLRGSLVPT